MKYQCRPQHFNEIGKQIVSDSWLHAFFVWLNHEHVTDTYKTIEFAQIVAQRMSGHTLQEKEKNAKLQLLEQIIKTYE
jgi:hypothetical protein